MYRELLETRLDVLRRQKDLTLRVLEIQPGIDEQSLERILNAAPHAPKPTILDFYHEINGLELSWSVYEAQQEIYGSIVIPPLHVSLFGYGGDQAQAKYEDAFEDVLWNTDSYAESSIRELRQHRLFEIIEGEPAAVTYKPTMRKARLFHVYEEVIQPINVDFAKYVQLVFEFLGASGIREALTTEDWEQAIQNHTSLQRVARWFSSAQGATMR